MQVTQHAFNHAVLTHWFDRCVNIGMRSELTLDGTTLVRIETSYRLLIGRSQGILQGRIEPKPKVVRILNSSDVNHSLVQLEKSTILLPYLILPSKPPPYLVSRSATLPSASSHCSLRASVTSKPLVKSFDYGVPLHTSQTALIVLVSRKIFQVITQYVGPYSPHCKGGQGHPCGHPLPHTSFACRQRLRSHPSERDLQGSARHSV